MESKFKTEKVAFVGRCMSFIIALSIASICKGAILEQRFAWKEVDYEWNTPEERLIAMSQNRYIPYNNLPMGLARWKNKLFITVPKWREGVVSSLNYVDIDGAQDQPLKPYPSFEDNYISDTAVTLPSNSSIISVYRVYVDACDRLWVMDSGAVNVLGSPYHIAGPSIVIFDLNTDTLITRHFLNASDVTENSFLGNIIVDVDKDTCDDAYAYVADIGGFALIVYSLKQDDSWRVTHEYFHYDPTSIFYNVSGLHFHWNDGVFGLALTEPGENGYRTLFFHAFSSTKEFYVSTEWLRNYRQISTDEAFQYFQLIGDRGAYSQASTSIYDVSSQVLLYTMVNRNGVGCWNTNTPCTPENNHVIISDANLLEFPNDLKMDDEGNMWVLSDRLPRFMFNELDITMINPRILSMKIADAIAGTGCELVLA